MGAHEMVSEQQRSNAYDHYVEYKVWRDILENHGCNPVLQGDMGRTFEKGKKGRGSCRWAGLSRRADWATLPNMYHAIQNPLRSVLMVIFYATIWFSRSYSNVY